MCSMVCEYFVWVFPSNIYTSHYTLVELTLRKGFLEKFKDMQRCLSSDLQMKSRTVLIVVTMRPHPYSERDKTLLAGAFFPS